MIHKKYEERNTRILKNYKKYRFDNKLVETNEEKEQMSKYTLAWNEYASNFPFLDFTVTGPPLNLFVRVIVVKNCGVVMIDDEFVQLEEGRILFVKKKCISHLIEAGSLRII